MIKEDMRELRILMHLAAQDVAEYVVKHDLCQYCKNPRGATTSKNYCQPCADRFKSRSSAEFQRLKKEGLCIWDCGNKARPGHVLCFEHGERNREAVTRYREKKLDAERTGGK